MNHPYPEVYADPIERGCGRRKPGGLYLECGLSKRGVSPEELMYDPALVLPPGLDLINKPQILPRLCPILNAGQVIDYEPEFDLLTGQPIYDVYIWIGEEFYPSLADFVEEARIAGISRQIPRTLKVELLTRASQMVLVHPCARLRIWRDLCLPKECRQHRAAHDLAWFEQNRLSAAEEKEQWKGPCVFKAWEVLPKDEACEVITLPGEEPAYYRRVGEHTYRYSPTDEDLPGDAWDPGIFMRVQITGAALVYAQSESGEKKVNQSALERLMRGVDQHGEDAALPFYETDQ